MATPWSRTRTPRVVDPDILVVDFDRTLSTREYIAEGHRDLLPREVVEELLVFRAEGFKVFVNTGRQWGSLMGRPTDDAVYRLAFNAFQQSVDGIVAESGAVIWTPGAQGRQAVVAWDEKEWLTLKAALALADLSPMVVATGSVQISSKITNPLTAASNYKVAKVVIEKTGVRADILVNGREMNIVPKGVNKFTGLVHLFERAGLLSENARSREQRELLKRCVGVGDTEGDLDFIRHCAVGVAVANIADGLSEEGAESISRKFDYVTKEPFGGGVMEVMDLMRSGEIASMARSQPGLSNECGLSYHAEL